jgi:hypothetical protein
VKRKIRALRVLLKIFLFPSFFRRAYFKQKILSISLSLTFCRQYETKTADLTDAAEKKSHGKEKRKNETKEQPHIRN